jgi:hypothetical protein
MPNYIRSFEIQKTKVEAPPMILKIRVIAVRHLRTNQAKSILKVQVKTTIINKQKPGENPTCISKSFFFKFLFFKKTISFKKIATINGPCGFGDSKQSSKHHDQLHTYNHLKSDDSDVDLIYFEVCTDNQEFCGQSVIPLSSLRTGFFLCFKILILFFISLGIRSVQLYDKFNERLDMSALLVDIHFKTGILLF